MRLALWTCASLSIAAHALAVTLLPPVERPTPVHVLASGRSTWLIQPTRNHTAAAQTATHHEDQQEPSWPEPSAQPSISASTEIPESTPESQPDAQEQTSPEAPMEATSGANGNIDGLTEYIPRPQLSVPPVAQAPVIMTAPQGDYPDTRITGILSIYIDETGKVNHIVSSGPDMPREFEEAARQTFMSLPFRPGVLDGAPVKSRIRIEVVFDNTPLPEDADKPKP